MLDQIENKSGKEINYLKTHDLEKTSLLITQSLAFELISIESWYLTPKIVGDKVGLHPLVVMIALLAGGGLAGIWGMLLAIPITAVADVLAREGLNIYKKSHAFKGSA